MQKTGDMLASLRKTLTTDLCCSWVKLFPVLKMNSGRVCYGGLFSGVKRVEVKLNFNPGDDARHFFTCKNLEYVTWLKTFIKFSDVKEAFSILHYDL